jgi:ribosomal protein S18 acetylase RimI-like enzyme
MTNSPQPKQPETRVERLTAFHGPDLHDLCDAADAAIQDGGGFGWLSPPPRQVMETYWKGVLLVPERELFVARLDGVIAGSAQLHRAAKNNEAQSTSGRLTTFFLAPWARGYGLAVRLVEQVEQAAASYNLKVLNLDVRETQKRAIEVYEQLGFLRWGVNPHYVFKDGQWLSGFYYQKTLAEEG